MTGKASPAKAAEGDEPVFAYIATMPQPQRVRPAQDWAPRLRMEVGRLALPAYRNR